MVLFVGNLFVTNQEIKFDMGKSNRIFWKNAKCGKQCVNVLIKKI